MGVKVTMRMSMPMKMQDDAGGCRCILRCRCIHAGVYADGDEDGCGCRWVSRLTSVQARMKVDVNGDEDADEYASGRSCR